MAIDPDAIKALLQRTDLVALVSQDAQVKKAGKEFKALCMFHEEQSPSFTIFEKNGAQLCRCHGCGWPETGPNPIGAADAIRYIMDKRGLGFKDAYEYLGGQPELARNVTAETKTAKRDWISTKPPTDEPPPNFDVGIGKPSRVWTYRDADGAILGYIARYDLGSNGSSRKEIRPFTWGHYEDEDEERWQAKTWTKPRPLYGIDRLAARPNAPVLITEGEKACDAAQELLPQYVCVAWPGGAQSLKHADLEPLRARRLLLWPDADPPGIECMAQLARVASDPRALAAQVKAIDVTGQPDGWDAADALAEGFTPTSVVEWAKPRISLFTVPEAGQVPLTARVGTEEETGNDRPANEPPTTPDRAEGPPEESPPAATPAPEKLKRKPRSKTRAKEDLDRDDAQDEGENNDTCPLTEDDLAEHFAEKHADKWLYVNRWGQWYEWKGDGWHQDEMDRASRLAIEICRAALYRPEARDFTGPQRRALGRKATAWNARDMAARHPKLSARTDQWDTHRELLGIPGAVVDLALGKVIEARPDQYITKRAAVAPEKGSPELWLKFLNTAMDGNQDMILYLQRFAGYCLTGITREQCLVFLYGTGQNGKGVFITTLKNILGDYALSADADVFMATEQNRHPTERARLRGARLVAVDETDSTKRWNEALIKRVTGGGKMEAHFMRQDTFEFEPEFKLLVAGNHKPQLRGVGKAIQRRFHMVPFTVTIPDEDRDDKLPEKLEAEYPRILQWMIEGCMAWRDYGLAPPEKVQDATRDYLQSEDTIGEWLEERTEQKGETLRPNAYKDYKGWMDGRGERAWSSKAWWAAVEERGHTTRKTSGLIFIKGLALKNAGGPPSEGPPPWHYSDDR